MNFYPPRRAEPRSSPGFATGGPANHTTVQGSYGSPPLGGNRKAPLAKLPGSGGFKPGYQQQSPSLGGESFARSRPPSSAGGMPLAMDRPQFPQRPQPPQVPQAPQQQQQYDGGRGGPPQWAAARDYYPFWRPNIGGRPRPPQRPQVGGGMQTYPPSSMQGMRRPNPNSRFMRMLMARRGGGMQRPQPGGYRPPPSMTDAYA